MTTEGHPNRCAPVQCVPKPEDYVIGILRVFFNHAPLQQDRLPLWHDALCGGGRHRQTTGLTRGSPAVVSGH